jgi:Pectate lyase superfamily protein
MAVTPVGTPVMTRATSGSVTGTWGTGQNRTAGNMLYALVSAGGSTASAAAISTPSGWTQVTTIGNTATTANAWVAVYQKIAAGSDSAPSFTATLSGTAAMTCTLLEDAGCLNAAPVQAYGVYQSGGSSGTLSSMTATTGLNPPGGAYAVTIYCQEASAATNTWNAGSGWTNLANDGTTNSVLHTAVDYQVPSTSGNVSETAHWTADTSAFGAAIVLVICPPAGLELYAADVPSTTVTAGGTDAPAAGTVEILTVSSSAGFPAASNGILPPGRFHIADEALPSEDIEVINEISSTDWLVVRGADGTVPVEHASGWTAQQVVNAGTFGSLPQWYNVRSRRFGATGNGSTDDTAAIQLAVTECIANGGGVVYLPPGTYKTSSTITAALTTGVSLLILGDGWPATSVSYYGSGDCIRMYCATGSSPNLRSGIAGVLFDGTNAAGNSSAVHAGDMTQMTFNCRAQNFTAGTTSKGFWFDNQYTFTEQLTGQVYASNCTAHVVFDVSSGAALTATGSFDRTSLDIYIGQDNAAFDGVVLQNGAYIIDGALNIRGNFSGSSTPVTSAVLRLTGTVAAGHPDAGDYASLQACQLNIGVECTSGTYAPATIAVGSSSNVIAGCYGVMDFAAASPFTAAANSAKSALYPFNGVILGDSNLQLCQGFPDNGANWNIPSGMSLGNYDGATALSNGSTISTAGVAVVRVSSAANVTGIILEAGSPDGQLVWVVNTTGFSVTFAAAGTSNVADGTSGVIPPYGSRLYTWDDVVTSLWYASAGDGVYLPPGTASAAPMYFTSGSLLTAAAAGAAEYDGAAAYITNETTSGRGLIPVEQKFRLTSTGGTISTIANYFGSNSNISLVSGGEYEIEIDCWFLVTTTDPVTWTFANSAAPTSMNLEYKLSPTTGIATTAVDTYLFGDQYNITSATATVTTGSLTTAVNHHHKFWIRLINGTGTSLKIQATKNTSGTITPGIGSYWKARRVPAANVGSFSA